MKNDIKPKDDEQQASLKDRTTNPTST